jgi:glutamyl-tRNA reductase
MTQDLTNSKDFEALCHGLIKALKTYKEMNKTNEEYSNRLIDYVEKELENSKKSLDSSNQNWETVARNLWIITNYYFNLSFDFSLEDHKKETEYSEYLDTISKLFETTEKV